MLKIIIIAHLAFIIFISLFCLIFRFVNPPFTAIMLYRNIFYHYRIKPVAFVRLSNIPAPMRWMVLRLEDSNFYTHFGIDLGAISGAIQRDRAFGRLYFGGSTITQQLSRTIFLTPDKSFFRKYLEAITALDMNIIIPKNRVLELYFNYAEWGKGIFGVQRASWYYYDKSLSSLNYDEMARLCVILSSPIRYNPYNFSGRLILMQRYSALVGPDSTNTNQDITLSEFYTNNIITNNADTNITLPQENFPDPGQQLQTDATAASGT